MITSTRRWFRRNRTNFAIGAGVLGAGYLAGQYILGKVSEARQRMSDERIAKENLRRRFEQNQEDCSYTVLAILPTATENILDAIPVEQILDELQKHKADRLARSVNTSEIASSVPPSIADDDSKSLTSTSESFIHATQAAEGSSTISGDGAEAVAPQAPKPKRTKAQLWNEMKIMAISRAFTLLYTLSLLTLLTRIQLNLLGRRNYLASVVSLASPHSQESRINLENHEDENLEHAYGNDFETNRRYLSLSWWLLHRGCIELMHKVTAAVKEVFAGVNPREEITLERLSELTLEVRKKVEGATEEERRINKWLSYLLPSPSDEEYVLYQSGMTTAATTPTSPSLRRLVDETSDLIDSPAFTHVLTLLLDAAFSHLVDNRIAQLSYKIPPTSASTARVQEIVGGDAKAKVANSLAVFCRQAHNIGSGANNEYLAAIEQVKDLEAFAAVVYSSNFEFEAPNASGNEENVGGAESTRVSRLSTAGAVGAPGPETYAEVVGKGEGFDGGDNGFEDAWGKALAKEGEKEEKEEGL
ncbi:Peroxin-3 [Delitschia confertaspora ATCC 74209]|uniref:Peroxin-3 n=1 Tax=Delitschia confertaspora ATCC 74209 TaxID=1513339 RepID=A0A9P4JK67_9PLEO|nr:Peroxin-3 [Delitschia confertaspora ATCC 74209]